MTSIDALLDDDRDIDYVYLLRLMRWKVAKMADRMRASKILDADTLVSQMSRCVMLMDRIIEDNYLADDYQAHAETWGEKSCPVCGELFCSCFPTPGGYEIVWLYDKARTDEQDTQACQEYLSIGRRAKFAKECDVRELFEILSDHILEWWC